MIGFLLLACGNGGVTLAEHSGVASGVAALAVATVPLFTLLFGYFWGARNTRLEWAGHVHIRPDWDDARQKFVSISPSGRAARDAAVQAVAPMIADVVAALGADRVRAVLPVLREMRARLEQDN